jgi:Uma2 family endonuclease
MASGALVIEDAVLGTEGRVRIPASIFDLKSFLRWVHSPDFSQRGRFSYLDGEVNIDMSPEELLSHNFPKGDLYQGLGGWVRKHKLGRLFADRALLVNEAANLSTEPDIMICLWKSLRSGRVRLTEVVKGSGRFVEVQGSPDIVVEIVSSTSVQKDTQDLPPRYFAAGVVEYWLVDARGEGIDFRILQRGRSGFTPVKADARGFIRSKVLGGAFRILRKRDPIGGWEYRLLSKP